MVILDFYTESLNIRYSYGKKPRREASINIGYAYGSQDYTQITDPLAGFKAPATQSVVNNLPPWMSMRQSESTRGWELVNSYGMGLESLVDLTNKHMRNMFLATADRNSRFRYYKGELTIDELFEFTPSRNVLANSSFSKPDVSRTALPMNWTDYKKIANTQTVFLDSDRVLKGTNSVRIDGLGTVSQIVDISGLSTVKNMTASVYVYSDSSVDVSVVLSVQGLNTGIQSSEIRYVDTPSGWERISVTVPVDKEGFEAQIVLRSNSSSTVYFDCAQLEVSDSATDWQASDADKLVYLDSAIPIRLVESRSNTESITLYPISNVTDFSEALIPTRLAPMKTKPIDLEPFSSSSLGRRVDIHNDITSISWRVVDGKVAATALDNQYDVFESYDIRDLRFFQGQGYGTIDDPDATIVPLATAVRDDILFVACKETFRGNTIRTLKVLVAKRPPNDETYLESIVDFKLDLKFDNIYGAEAVSEEISSIGFSEKDPAWMIVNTSSGRRLYFRLYFDYYFANLSTRAIYTLENYTGSQLQVA